MDFRLKRHVDQITMPVCQAHIEKKTSVGIDLKELEGQMSKCLKFCPGIEI